MREENINTIRRECIKANPEIMELKLGCNIKMFGDSKSEAVILYPHSPEINSPFCTVLCTNGDPTKSFNGNYIMHEVDVSSYEGWKILGRPIRLADVLLAISHQSYFIGTSIREGYGCWYKTEKDENGDWNSELIGCPEIYSWNLRTDSLTEQSDETLQFLADLLK